VEGMQGFTVEDATFRWNNWGGLGIRSSENVVVRRSVAIYNGARGMSDWKNRNMLFEDTETSYNNWRGAWGRWHDWSAAGIKNMLLHGGVFRRHKSVGNAAFGFWLDTDNRDIRIDDGFWCDNIGGAFVEASQGPITIARATICKNTSAGLVASTSGHVTVRDSILYDNGDDAQFATNDEPFGTIRDWETGHTLILRTEHWTFCGDAFVATKRSQAFLSLPSWDFFHRTLNAAQNVYWNPVRPDAFWVRGPVMGGQALDLPAWRRTSGQDEGSIYADPKFADPDRGDFTRLPSSPWRRCP
jgi:Right handed beta helix region